MATAIMTIVPPGAQSSSYAASKPTMTESSPKKTEYAMACLKLLAMRMLAATGSVMSEETSSTPTMRIDAAMTRATSTINKNE